jgi:c-di-AMP phosphodiesterase-like protein
MFILDLLFFRGLTELIWILILVTGIVFWAASFIVKPYKLPLQIIGTLVIIVSVYNMGMAANEAKWQQRVDQLEEQVKRSEAESAAANQQLSSSINDKRRLLQENQKEVVKYIDRFIDREVLKTVEGPEREKMEKVIEYVENCTLPKELVDLHNQAAQRTVGEKK